MSNQVSIKEKNYTPMGKRLLSAFAAVGITNKQELAENIGFRLDKQLYKVLNGTQKLKIEQLLEFREKTGRSIDWLLFGEIENGTDTDLTLDTKNRNYFHLTDLDETSERIDNEKFKKLNINHYPRLSDESADYWIPVFKSHPKAWQIEEYFLSYLDPDIRKELNLLSAYEGIHESGWNVMNTVNKLISEALEIRRMPSKLREDIKNIVVTVLTKDKKVKALMDSIQAKDAMELAPKSEKKILFAKDSTVESDLKKAG